MEILKLVLYVYLTPLLALSGLFPNGVLLHYSNYLEETYPAGIFIFYFLNWINTISCVLAFIWPWLYNLGKLLNLSYSYNLYCLIYVTHFHPVLLGILSNTTSLLLILFSFERVITIEKNKQIKWSKKPVKSNSERTGTRPIYRLFKCETFIGKLTSVIEYTKFLMTNPDFLILLSLISLAIAIPLSMVRISWYSIVSTESIYDKRCMLLTQRFARIRKRSSKWTRLDRMDNDLILAINCVTYFLSIYIAIHYKLCHLNYRLFVEPCLKLISSTYRDQEDVHQKAPKSRMTSRRSTVTSAISVEVQDGENTRDVILSNLYFASIVMQFLFILPRYILAFIFLNNPQNKGLGTLEQQEDIFFRELPIINFLDLIKSSLGAYLLAFLLPETRGLPRSLLINLFTNHCIRFGRGKKRKKRQKLM
ncbi:unnamed protein product [Gordionus sp. m RMFG-2023]